MIINALKIKCSHILITVLTTQIYSINDAHFVFATPQSEPSCSGTSYENAEKTFLDGLSSIKSTCKSDADKIIQFRNSNSFKEISKYINPLDVQNNLAQLESGITEEIRNSFLKDPPKSSLDFVSLQTEYKRFINKMRQESELNKSINRMNFEINDEDDKKKLPKKMADEAKKSLKLLKTYIKISLPLVYSKVSEKLYQEQLSHIHSLCRSDSTQKEKPSSPSKTLQVASLLNRFKVLTLHPNPASTDSSAVQVSLVSEPQVAADTRKDSRSTEVNARQLE